MTRAVLIALIVLIATLSASPNLARAVDCPNAPASRLNAEQTAVIAPGIGPLNLRALPAVDTGIEQRLYEGARLFILSGPSCNGTRQWWRVETEGGQRGWVAEGDWEAYFIVPANIPWIPTPLEWSCPPYQLRQCPVP